VIVYRIAQRPYIEDLSGTGAFLYGGRWNLKGVHALYTASSMSLAYLEFLVHQFERDTWPGDMYISEIEIKSSQKINSLSPEKLPVNWKDLKYHGETQQVCQQYFSTGIMGISVPSVIVPREFNIILNPLHPEYQSSIKISQIEPLEIDKRFGIC